MDNMIIWAAGFMDGEGTFTLKRIKRKGFIYHQPYISCGQVVRGKATLNRLRKLFGGSFYKYRQKGFHQDTLQWVVASQKAKRCAEQLLPYLCLKHRQAKIIIDFYKIILHREKQYKLSADDYKKREKLFEKIRKLNVKGKLRLKRLSEETPKGDATV